MSFCPRCGATSQHGMAFCASCGAPLAQGPPPPPAYAPPASGHPSQGYAPAYAHVPPYAYAGAPQGYAGPAPRGPVGRIQEAWVPLVLTLVTFGIYSFVYWWRVTREVDERLQQPGHSHHLARVAVIIGSIAAGVAFVVLIAMFAAIVSSVDPATGEPPDEAAFQIFAFFPLLILVWMVAIAAFIMLVVAMWRVWTFIQQEERRSMRSDPINPALMVVLVAVPIVSSVGVYLALYMTQDRLNRLWQIGAAELAAQPRP